jgi:uncharacterized membrane protein YebE (DUF533 family)
MDTTEIVLVAVAFVALGFSLYRKYTQKNQGKTYGSKPSQSGSLFQSHAEDDDYEPYSGK